MSIASLCASTRRSARLDLTLAPVLAKRLSSTALAAAATAAVAGLWASSAIAQVTGPSSDGVDGIVNTGEYPLLLASQNNPTQFGDQTAPATTGSELDALYASVNANGSIKLAVTGDFENNGNGVLFLVQNQLSGGAIVSTVSGPGSNNYGVAGQLTGTYNYGFGTYYGSGSVFAPGFNPNQAYAINNYTNEPNAPGSTTYIDLHDENQIAGGGNVNPSPDTYMGSVPTETDTNPSPSTVSPFAGTTGAFGAGTLEFALNDSNIAGVTGTTAAAPGSNLTGDPLTATTGLELGISAQLLNQDPTEPIKIQVSLWGSGAAYLSNQFLPGLSTSVGTANIGTPNPIYDARIDAANPLQDYVVIPFITWGDTTGNYSTTANWSFGTIASGVVPLGQDVTAQFAGASTARTVTLDEPVTLGGIILDPNAIVVAVGPTASYTLAGTNTLTLDTFGQTARIVVDAGSNTISAPVVLNQKLDVSVAASSGLTFSGNVSLGTATASLIKDGPGTLAFNSTSATVASLSVTGGTLAVNGGTLTINQGSGAGSLGAFHAPTSGTLGTSVINGGTLTLATGATLDLTTHAMVINYNGQAWPTNNYEGIPSPVGELTFGKHTPTQSYPAGSVTRYIQTASDGGSWDLPGITSSVAENDFTGTTAVGVIDQNDLFALQGNDYTTANGGPGTWEGVPVANDNNVLVRYTYYGDTNLDGTVNATDVDNLIQGFEGFGDGWLYGDFNYDGIVNGQDVTELIIGFSGQKGSMGDGGISPGQAQFLLSLATGITPAQVAKFDAIVGVPEPTTIGLLGAAGLGLLGRRRRA